MMVYVNYFLMRNAKKKLNNQLTKIQSNFFNQECHTFNGEIELKQKLRHSHQQVLQL